MESWQFQLLLAVINESVAAPLPRVSLLTRGAGARTAVDVDASPEVSATVDTVTALRCVRVLRSRCRSLG